MAGASTMAGAESQKEESRKAKRAQTRAAELARFDQQRMFGQAESGMAPWRKAGKEAFDRYQEKVYAGPGEFVPEDDPGYKFGYEEFVEKPQLRAAAAGGRLGDTRTQKELTRYASDYASTKYDNYLDRWYKSLQPLQGMADMGYEAQRESSNRTMGLGQALAGNRWDMGNARASGFLRKGEILGAGTKAQGESNWKIMDTIMSMYGGSSGGGGGGMMGGGG